MNWRVRRRVKSSVDLPGIISAPWLLLLFVLCTIVIGFFENELRSQQTTAIVVQIDPVVEDEGLISGADKIPEHLQQYIEQWISSSKVSPLSVEKLTADPKLKALNESEQKQVYAYLGKSLVRQNRYDEANNILQLLDQQTRSQLGSGFAYALSLSKVGKYEQAITAYIDELVFTPAHQASAINLGLLQLRVGQHENAVSSLDYAAQISSGQRKGKSFAAKGRALQALKWYAEAEQAFIDSINYRPGHSMTWLQLAEVRRQNQKESEQIISAYSKASSLAPSNYAPVYRMANYFLSEGRFRQAIPLYSKAHQLAKDRFNVLFYRAVNLYVSGRPSGAKRVVKLLKRKELSKNQKLQIRMLSSLLSADKDEIRRYLKRLQKGKQSEESLFLEIAANIELNNLKVLQKQHEVIEQESVFFLPVHYLYVRKLYGEKSYTAAKSLLDEILELGGQSPQIQYEYSRIMEKLSKNEIALAYAKKAYLLEPASKKISLELSDQLLKSGQQAQAIAVLKALADRYPTYSRGVDLLSGLLIELNQLGQAEQVLSTALEGDSENSALLKRLIEIHYKKYDYKQTLMHIDQLLLLDSSLVDVRVIRVHCLINLQKLEEAKREIGMIQALSPTNRVLAELQQHLQESAK